MDEKEKSILEGTIVPAAVLPNGELFEIEKEKASSPEVLKAYVEKLDSYEKKNDRYILMNGDKETLLIDLSKQYIQVLNNHFLPISLKDFIKTTDTNDFAKALKDITAVRDYLASRVLSLSRTNAKAILNSVGLPQGTSTEEKIKIVLACRGVSMLDNFWLKKEDENIRFADVNLRKNKLSELSYQIAILGRTVSATAEELSPDLTTLGMFPKFWKREDDKVYFLKTDQTNGYMNTKVEVQVSEILESLGIEAVKYTLFEDKDGRLFAKSQCFCSDEISFVSGQDVKDHCTRVNIDFMDYIKRNFIKDFSNMVMVDYVLANTDRHMENFGFLVDNTTNEIISMAPLYDHNQALIADYFDTDIDDLIYEPTNQLFSEAVKEFIRNCNIDFSSVDIPQKALERWQKINYEQVKKEAIESKLQPPEESGPKLM